jgi:hypothetical protein
LETSGPLHMYLARCEALLTKHFVLRFGKLVGGGLLKVTFEMVLVMFLCELETWVMSSWKLVCGNKQSTNTNDGNSAPE